MVILVTGFEPYNKYHINASKEIVDMLPERIGNIKVFKHILPVAFGRAVQKLYVAIEEHKPSVVVCTGQAAGRKDLGIERFAVNINNTSIPDNDGNRPVDEIIVPDGPAGYFSNFPVQKLVKLLGSKGIPASISYFAGTYLCNHVFYALMHYIHNTNPNMYGGFIHLPLIDAQQQLHPEACCQKAEHLAQSFVSTLEYLCTLIGGENEE